MWAWLLPHLAAAQSPATVEAGESPSEGSDEADALPGVDEALDAGGIINGTRERGYDAAVGLGAGGFTVCSGSLITPRIVLTAGHCSADLPIELVVALGQAFFGTEASDPDASLGFKDGIIHPGYRALTQSDLGENDVAVLFLSADAPVPPVWFRTEPLKPKDAEGAEVISVGWGLDELNQSNVKRSAPLLIGDLDPTFIVSYSAQNENQANICSGDSGGPQYHIEEDGTVVQWAVHSWGDVNCVAESGSTRTDKVADWILEQVEREHGTTDRCEIFGQYGDGVCHTDCAQFDMDCFEPAADASTFPAASCGCAEAPGALSAWPLALLLGLGLRRRSN